MRTIAPSMNVLAAVSLFLLALTLVPCQAGAQPASSAGPASQAAPKATIDMDLAAMIQPVPKSAKFIDEDYYIWCGSMVRTDDGKCHLYYSRWPRKLGHYAWVTHSEVAHAVADTPLGPYKHVNVALPARGEQFWDGQCTHNPTVIRSGGKFYLYYMGTHGDGQAMKTLNWTYRNNQRVGVAVADNPNGPWTRMDKPVIDVTPGFYDALCATNPTVTEGPAGKFVMIYKGVGDKKPLPFGGPVLLLVATADSPTGPFKKYDKPVFVKEGVNFAAEDPFIWYQDGHYYALVKDNAGHFANAGKSVVLFESADGFDWKLGNHPLVTKIQVQWEGGALQKLYSLERPQLWLDNGKPAVLFCAADETDKREHSFNVAIPLKAPATTPAAPVIAPPASAADANMQRATFREVDTLFANPGAGWMSQNRSGKGEPRFPCSVVYIRFGWADVEPKEGEYNWKLIDDVIAAWKSRGAAVSMRVMTCSAHSSGYYTSPKWLFDAGCKGFEYTVGGDDPTSGGKRIARIEPDYADPIYLAKHGAFLKAMGKRYDGHPDVEFLDIGSYGVWGEWHTKHAASVDVRKQIVDMYLDAFHKTPMVFMTDDAEVLAYAIPKGVGLRRDGVGSPWHEQNWIGSKKYAAVEGMADTWKKSPVVFEWFGNYDYLKSRKWSFDAAVDFMLKNHVTMINDNFGRFPPEALPQLQKLARLAGYRFVLRELSHSPVAKPGTSLDVKMKWANVGVGKLYRPFKLRLLLLDAAGQTVCTADARSDPRDWLPGDHDLAESIQIPAALKAGEYTLTVSLIDPAGQKQPLKLAMDAPEKEGRYTVSKVKVE